MAKGEKMKNQIAFSICPNCKKNGLISPLRLNNGQAVCPIHEIYFNNVPPKMFIESSDDRNHC